MLDYLHDGVLNRLSGGSGIGTADRDARRRDVRILTHGQPQERDDSRQRNQNRDDPGENRSFDETTRHVLVRGNKKDRAL